MSLFKTGHKDFPSLSHYTMLVNQYGPDSSEAQSYLGRFLADETFVRHAEAVRGMFLVKNATSKPEER